MLRKGVGLILYLTGVGLWIILAATFLLYAIPLLLLSFLAGWLAHSREWPELKEMRVWEWLRERYFKFESIFNSDSPYGESELKGPLIYAIYPHGHYSFSAVFYFALNPKFRFAKPAVHSMLFYVPLFASFMRWIGAIDVTRASMIKTLRQGTSLYMCPGGIAEICKTGTDVVKREGFLSVAREAGALVVPVWCPQEREYFSHWLPFGHRLSRILGFPIPIFIWGRWWCPLIPKAVAGKSEIRFGRAINPANVDEFWQELENLQKK